jgi:hypothetical protein
MQEHMTHGTGSLNADLWIDPTLDPLSDGGDSGLMEEHILIPHSPSIAPSINLSINPSITPSSTPSVFAVTVNFPDMALFHAVDYPPEYSTERELLEVDIAAPVHEWQILPGKLQPPAFRVHRCHHPGVERGGENNDFELPSGFPEAIQHIQQSPEHVCMQCPYH